jgi:hypothetical protein
MILTRCKDQKSKTLDEFYQELGRGEREVSRSGAKAMLELIARLRAHPDSREIFGLTSHSRLCLLAVDDYTSPWHVVVAAFDQRSYFVDYLVPPNLGPWPNARMTGEARSEDEALEMVLIAMERSQGWH